MSQNSLSFTVSIDAARRWTSTGVRLQAGETYALSVSGQWRDASIDSGPSGYASVNLFQRATERLRRVPSAPWFALVGAIDRLRDTQFVIGGGCVYRAIADGELTCFANDLLGFYWNNSGSVTLHVTKVEDSSVDDAEGPELGDRSRRRCGSTSVSPESGTHG
ncbi:MAG: hypothetical protein U0Q12_12805 [Vicinamibacterales bacterium]